MIQKTGRERSIAVRTVYRSQLRSSESKEATGISDSLWLLSVSPWAVAILLSIRSIDGERVRDFEFFVLLGEMERS